MVDYLSFSYPRFMPAQTLKSSDLNAIVDYLEHQDRLTRVYLIGAGIFYGLEPRCQTDGGVLQVCISKGAAVSSEGYLFVLREDCCYDAWQWVSLRRSAFVDVPPDAIDNSLDILELKHTVAVATANTRRLVAPAPEEAGGAPEFTEENVKNKAIVLLWEVKDKERRSCLNTCDGSGADKELNLRVLAMDCDMVNSLWDKTNIPDGTDPDQLTAYPFVKRLFTHENWPDFDNAPALYNAWELLIDQATNAADSPLPVALAPALKSIEPDINPQTIVDRIAAFKAMIPAGQRYLFQYLYDYLHDLVAAYEELSGVQTSDVLTWCPDENSFPRFVSLGYPAEPRGCRMGLYFPEIANREQAKSAFLRDRLRRMLEITALRWVLNPATDTPLIRITGSKWACKPLSQRAIPYYFSRLTQSDPFAHIRPYWSYELHRDGRTTGIQGYEKETDIPPRQNLCFNLEGADFFRIEGHIGQSLKYGYETVEAQRNRMNLPFQITAVRIGDAHYVPIDGDNDPELALIIDQFELDTYAPTHPGLEHFGGVPRGGTFILVYEETIVNPTQYTQLNTIRDLIIKDLPVQDPETIILYKRYFQIQINQFVRRTIVADFCLPYSSFNVPQVSYEFEEVTNLPPSADFEDTNKVYSEVSVMQDVYPRVQVYLQNRSMYAHSYQWIFEVLDGEAGFAIPSQTVEHPVLNLNLNQVRRIKATLFAKAAPGSSFADDSAEKVIDLCPPELALCFVDDKGQNPHLEETVVWGSNESLKKVNVLIDPPGGALELFSKDFADMPDYTRNDRKVVITLTQAGQPQGVLLIRYALPCTGLKREIKLTIVSPNPLAVFAETGQRTIKEGGKSGTVFPLLEMRLENQSLNAQTYAWKFEQLLPSSPTIISPSPAITDPHEKTQVLQFDLEKVQRFRATLTAKAPSKPDHETSHVFDLCPDAVQIQIIEPASNNPHHYDLQWKAGLSLQQVVMQFDPPGGKLTTTWEGQGGAPPSTRNSDKLTVEFNQDKNPFGTYTVIYRYPGCKLESAATIQVLPINDFDNPVVNPAGSPSRFVTNIEAANDAGARTNDAYIRTESFLKTPFTSIAEAEPAFSKLVRFLSSRTGDAARLNDEQLRALLTNSVWRFLDVIVEENPSKIPESVENLLGALLPVLEQQNVDLAALRKGWRSEEAKKSKKSKIVQQILKLLEP